MEVAELWHGRPISDRIGCQAISSHGRATSGSGLAHPIGVLILHVLKADEIGSMIYMLPPGLACMLTHRQKLAIDCFGCESLLQTSGSASPRFHNSPSKCHRIKMYIIGLTACLTSVRITNRGPFARARIADVRRAATRNLDMVKSDRSPGFTERPAQKELRKRSSSATFQRSHIRTSTYMLPQSPVLRHCRLRVETQKKADHV